MIFLAILMKLLVFPIHASNSVKIIEKKDFLVTSIYPTKIQGNLIITLIPVPKNNPVIFRQYELLLPKNLQISNIQLPNGLYSKKIRVTNHYKLIINPKSNILLVDKSFKIRITLNIVPVRKNSQYTLFIIPHTENVSVLKGNELNKLYITTPISDDYTGLVIVNNNLFISETLYIQEFIKLVPTILLKVLILALIKAMVTLFIVISSFLIIMYNIVWIRKHLLKYP